MNTPTATRAPVEHSVRVSFPKVTIAMILCGIVSAAGIGAASAATADDVPSAVVKYQPDSLLSDAGAQAVYRRIVKAAEEVCPAMRDERLPSAAVRQCRAESITRAVMTINSSRLAAIHDNVSRSG